MSKPASDEDRLLHQRLLDRDVIASKELAVEYLPKLIHWLTEHNRTIYPELISEAAEDAILGLIRKPTSYQPERGALEEYLRMSAQGDLRNILHREKVHLSRYQPQDPVELSALGRNKKESQEDPLFPLLIDEELARLDNEVPAAVRERFTEEENRVLDLMQRGERRTSEYAEALGITNRSPADQRRLVKQIKDRIQKRLERQGGS